MKSSIKIISAVLFTSLLLVVGFIPFNSPIVNANENLDSEELPSKVYAENNFYRTGNHADIKNEYHRFKLLAEDISQENPIAFLIDDPDDVKNEDLTYNYGYEYTNHLKEDYSCVDGLDGECFKWELKKTTPVWTGNFAKSFLISENDGEFEHYHTNRIGKINDKEALIYPNPTSATGSKAGSSMVGQSYFIKEKAVKGNESYYLLSNNQSRTSGVIGWVNELDLTTYTHFNMDNKSKKVKVKVKGSQKYFSRVWGGGTQEAGNLSSKNGQTFNVSQTDVIGKNIWYRGKFKGTGNNYWLRADHTDSVELPIIKESDFNEPKISGTNNVSEISFVIDHNYGGIHEFNSENPERSKDFRVGREHNYEDYRVDKKKQDETISLDFNNEHLATQSFRTIDQKVDYHSDLENRLYAIDGERYYFVDNLDENLKEKYENDTEYSDKGDYVIPLRVSEFNTDSISFLSQDNFYVLENTGLAFSLPHEEINTTLINNKGKEVHQSLIQGTYRDKVLADPYNASRYFIDMSLHGEQEPGTLYNDNLIVGKLGLSDIVLHVNKKMSFDNYMFGHISDEPYFVEQRTRVLKDIEYENTISMSHEQILELKELAKDRKEKVHGIKPTDYFDKRVEVLNVVPH